MLRFSFIFALFLAGCATPTQTQKVLIRDSQGRAVVHCQVELWDPSAPQLLLSKGKTYTLTTTDRLGFCVLTYPTQRPYEVTVDQGGEHLWMYRKEAKPGYLEIDVKPEKLITYPPST